jgi:V8-like Glu-specific endopeptidase
MPTKESSTKASSTDRRHTSSTATRVPSGAHAPVSNAGGHTSEHVRRRTVEPLEGRDQIRTSTAADGTEAVDGYYRRSETHLAELSVPADLDDLPDIATASFGPPPPIAETVHGPDDRVQITNTAAYPWRATASLLITAADNARFVGTAWFIGPHTLMTAGHCVCIKNSGVPGRDGFVRSIQVMPGRNGSTLPFGSVTSTNFRSVAGWSNDGSELYDYGAIILPTDLGNDTGWLGFGVFDDATLTGSIGNIAGYPADKPSGTLWYDSRTVASVGPQKVHYDIDSYGGQSGAAVYRVVDNARYAFAIHAYGGAVTNSGTRIIGSVYDNMVAWLA